MMIGGLHLLARGREGGGDGVGRPAGLGHDVQQGRGKGMGCCCCFVGREGRREERKSPSSFSIFQFFFFFPDFKY